MNKNAEEVEPLLLGIECGGTRSMAILKKGAASVESRSGSANLRLVTDPQLVRHFRNINRALLKAAALVNSADAARLSAKPDAIAIGMAGARMEADRSRIRSAAAKVWPGVPCLATNDLETALAAVEPAPSSNFKSQISNPQVLVLSGTGSCCYGRTRDGRTAKVGGWGHILGDKGSGYEIGLRALKAVVYYFDRDGNWPRLGERLLRHLQLNRPEDLIGWVLTADKPSIAALAVEVFDAWKERDRIASDILDGAASTLATDAADCAAKLAKKGSPVQFVFNGGVLLRQPKFARAVEARIRKRWRNAVVTPLTRESVWGAVELAKRDWEKNSKAKTANVSHRKTSGKAASDTIAIPESRGLSPTEQRNPRSMKLHTIPLSEAIALMLGEEEKVAPALMGERKNIERAVQLIVRAFRRGGRLFYVGAGTSGRLGILDASECPPTFRTPPWLVQGIMAGGQTAIWQSVEGAEDDAPAGADAIRFRGVGSRDVVVGIAASGRTPFVWGALQAAERLGAATVFVTFNPNIEITAAMKPRVVIAAEVGPELLTGSTRLKAGTATKILLNILTTLAMVKIGKVVSNLMVDVNPSNAKLRERAIRIVRELTGVDEDAARTALDQSKWVVKEAWRMIQKRG